jgi:haloacetate dehalogenase
MAERTDDLSAKRTGDRKKTTDGRRIGRRSLIAKAATVAAGPAVFTARNAEAQPPAWARLFPGFTNDQVKTSGATINVVKRGQGPGLLLMHGAPQSLVTWHKIAPQLAKEYTVVAMDLRGYGDSSKPEGGANHVNYSKRAMALDGVEVMRHFGFGRFFVVGHDRGGRVAHRMALDHPDIVLKAAVIDIVPTHKLYNNVTREFATQYYHWFFLIRPAPFPETLINNSIEFYMGRGNPDTGPEYLRCFKNPATVHAMCEDYRAAASIDLEHDEADLKTKIQCPLLVLWAAGGAMGQQYPNMLDVWRERAANVTGRSLPGGHSLQETTPDETLAEILKHLRA